MFRKEIMFSLLKLKKRNLKILKNVEKRLTITITLPSEITSFKPLSIPQGRVGRILYEYNMSISPRENRF